MGYLGLIVGISPWASYLAFIFLGINFSTFMTSGMALLTEFAPAELRPVYVGLSNTLIGPFSFTAPIIGGILANRIGYKSMFLIAFILTLLGFFVMAFLVKEPRKTQ